MVVHGKWALQAFLSLTLVFFEFEFHPKEEFKTLFANEVDKHSWSLLVLVEKIDLLVFLFKDIHGICRISTNLWQFPTCGTKISGYNSRKVEKEFISLDNKKLFYILLDYACWSIWDSRWPRS